MSSKEKEYEQEMERVRLESETISTEYFKICEENEINQEKIRELERGADVKGRVEKQEM